MHLLRTILFLVLGYIFAIQQMINDIHRNKLLYRNHVGGREKYYGACRNNKTRVPQSSKL